MKLIIIRHGNTFSKGETPRRVGARTDLPLVPSGVEQAQALGDYLASHDLIPDRIYCAPLLRTRQTAEHLNLDAPIEPLEIFTEIDYGPDENCTEEEVIARIGSDAIERWNRHATVPPDWKVDPQAIIENWKSFAKTLEGTIAVVTSNGIARFAPYLTGDFATFAHQHSIKMRTGALSLLERTDHTWKVTAWNIRPTD